MLGIHWGVKGILFFTLRSLQFNIGEKHQITRYTKSAVKNHDKYYNVKQ